jgi:putative intracellular protease/amidase
MPRTKTILFVLTSHDRLGDTDETTGFYVPEAAHPWQVFTAAGHRVRLVSPRGGPAPRSGVDRSDPVQRAFLDDPDMAVALADTMTPDQVDPTDHDAIFFVGGHGTMWDFLGNEALARITAAIHDAGGVVSAVCHGPAGLLDVVLSDGRLLVDGRQVAAFTNAEEDAVGKTRIVPFLLQTALEERGAKHSAAPDFEPHVVVDERLVTGQNPASATGVAQAVLRILTAGDSR